MCKHKTIKVYDNGGTQDYCEKCGKPVGPWKPNSKQTRKEERKAIQNVQSNVQ